MLPLQQKSMSPPLSQCEESDSSSTSKTKQNSSDKTKADNHRSKRHSHKKVSINYSKPNKKFNLKAKHIFLNLIEVTNHISLFQTHVAKSSSPVPDVQHSSCKSKHKSSDNTKAKIRNEPPTKTHYHQSKKSSHKKVSHKSKNQIQLNSIFS